MSKINDGGPAFPSGDGEYGGGPNHCYGMTLRDWFAGQVFPAVLSAVSAGQHQLDLPQPTTKADVLAASARDAYEIADAMLSAREPKR